MNFSMRKMGILSQSIILVIFVAGMMTNYFLLSDIIEREQLGRIKGEILLFLYYCTKDWDEVENGTISLDSLCTRHKSYNMHLGEMTVIGSDGTIRMSTHHLEGNAKTTILAHYGQVGLDLLEEEKQLRHPDGNISTNWDTWESYYVNYQILPNVTIFYAFDRYLPLLKVFHVYWILMAFMIVGGLVVILLLFVNMRRWGIKQKEEIVAQRDLDTAANIQKSMLPRHKRHLMQIDIGARLIPAQGVGGDLFYYMLHHGQIYFCIGDVSGKGVPAALCMSRTVSLFRSLALESLSPAQIASRMNTELCINNVENMFVTAVIGMMNAQNGDCSYCNAGHEHPLYWDGQEDHAVDYMQGQGGLPLGIHDDSEYVENHFVLPQNGLWMLFTDGVNEARNVHGGFYGKNRLQKFVDTIKDNSSNRICKALLSNLRDFATNAPQSDDITMLTFRHISLPKELTIRNTIKDLRQLSDFIEEVLQECPFDSTTSMRVRTGLDEAVTNCVQYAYDRQDGYIQLKTQIENGTLMITVEDQGQPFNPLTYHSPEPQEDLTIGGLGISIMRASFDDIRYQRQGNTNILTLIKQL